MTKCKGGDCPLKKKCHKYMAKTDEETQEWFPCPPFKKSEISDEVFCDEFEKAEIIEKVKNIGKEDEVTTVNPEPQLQKGCIRTPEDPIL